MQWTVNVELGVAALVTCSVCVLVAARLAGITKGNSTADVKQGVLDCIGNTPLVRIKSLSDATGCEILAKAEFLNPGGSIKDRIALHMVRKAADCGRLSKGALITEATAGSTGVSLAMVAGASGYKCKIFMPDDAAVEKQHELEARGACVERVRPVAISHPQHMVHKARKAACPAPLEGGSASTLQSASGGFFADQFENVDNGEAHMETGEEIWRQCGGRVHAFVCGAGTGGTIAGVSIALKNRKNDVKIVLVDPPGSGLYLKVKRGVLYSPAEAEGRRKRNPFDTVTEGVGLNRLTNNFASARIDDAVQCSDQEAVDMAHFLLQNEGLWVGSSSAVNCVGAVKVARNLGRGNCVVTILCDGGHRHLSKFYDRKFLEAHDLQIPGTLDETLSWVGSAFTSDPVNQL